MLKKSFYRHSYSNTFVSLVSFDLFIDAGNFNGKIYFWPFENTRKKKPFCFQISSNSIIFVHLNQSVVRKRTTLYRAGHREIAVPPFFMLLRATSGIASPSLR